jgi:glycine/D-amino acid oxidase-like deaminating enzyme
VVIGAGAVGAAISYRLAQAGASVTTVERRFAGAGTTGSSFAWLNGFNKPPRGYHLLNTMSIGDHQQLAAELGGSWVHLDGGLQWEAAADAVRAESLRQTVGHLREWGTQVDRFSPEEVMRDVEPDVRIDPEAVEDVYVVPREGWLEGVTMAASVLQAAVRRHGAQLERATVVGLSGPSGVVNTVHLDDRRTLPADVVVNAAGPAAGRVAALAGVDLPLDRQPGMLAVTAPAPVSLKHVIHSPASYVRPDGASRLLLHHDRVDQYTSETERPTLEHPALRDLLAQTRTFVPGLRDVELETVRHGIRCVPRDGYPIIGFEPAVRGLYTAVTHSGITLSARIGLLVTDDLSGSDVPELAPYRPQRFADAAAREQVTPI